MSNPQNFSLSEITKVFSDFSRSDLFQEGGYSSDWIWHQFRLMQYYATKELSLEEIERILKLRMTSDNYPAQVESSYRWIKEHHEENPVLLSFIPVLLTYFHEKKHVYRPQLKDYIKSFAHVFGFGVVAGVAYYANFFNSLVLSLALLCVFYWLVTKAAKAIKNKKVENSISYQMKKLDTRETHRYEELLGWIAKINTSVLDEQAKKQFDILKKASIRISKVDDIAMWVDIERMWTQHVPLLVSQYDTSPEQVTKAFRAMQHVLESHLEEIFTQDRISITAKEKYWINKINQEMEL